MITPFPLPVNGFPSAFSVAVRHMREWLEKLDDGAAFPFPLSLSPFSFLRLCDWLEEA